jgi:hypothetical protein
MGDSRLKISTIHSFKGWEVRNLIILIPNHKHKFEKLDKLVYTSMTRSMASIDIINTNRRYIDFGNTWKVDNNYEN